MKPIQKSSLIKKLDFRHFDYLFFKTKYIENFLIAVLFRLYAYMSFFVN